MQSRYTNDDFLIFQQIYNAALKKHSELNEKINSEIITKKKSQKTLTEDEEQLQQKYFSLLHGGNTIFLADKKELKEKNNTPITLEATMSEVNILINRLEKLIISNDQTLEAGILLLWEIHTKLQKIDEFYHSIKGYTVKDYTDDTWKSWSWESDESVQYKKMLSDMLSAVKSEEKEQSLTSNKHPTIMSAPLAITTKNEKEPATRTNSFSIKKQLPQKNNSTPSQISPSNDAPTNIILRRSSSSSFKTLLKKKPSSSEKKIENKIENKNEEKKNDIETKNPLPEKENEIKVNTNAGKEKTKSLPKGETQEKKHSNSSPSLHSIRKRTASLTYFDNKNKNKTNKNETDKNEIKSSSNIKNNFKKF